MSKSLLKAINILDCFAEKQEMSINDLMEATNMSKTTVFRLATSLEEGGLLVKEKRSSHDVIFRLSLKFLTYGKYVSNRLQYNEVALPYMKQLNEEIDELVHLTVAEGNEAVYVETFYSSKPLRLVVTVGARAPLYAGSAPKLLLAGMKDKDLENYLNNVELEKITANTISSKEKLRVEIEKIRAAGYSISESENFDHTKGFSYPIYDYNGNIVAALGVSVPEKDYPEERQEIILSKLKETVVKIWEELGFNKENNEQGLIKNINS